MNSQKLKDEIEKTTYKLLVKWYEDFHEKIPHILWHFTDIQALHSILANKKIWFSQAIFLNDSSEMAYAVDLIEEIVKTKIKTIPSDKTKEYVQSFLDSLVYKKKSVHSHGITSPTFVSCFCENGDDLHLWRAYTGNGKGYSIGLFPDAILSKLKEFKIIESNYTANNEKKTWEWFFSGKLRKVIYDKDTQTKLIEELLNSFINLVSINEALLQAGNVNNSDKMYINMKFSDLFAEFLYCFKHPAFAEEKEWRFIYTIDKSHKDKDASNIEQKELKYRTSGSYLIPYLEIDISNKRERLTFETIISGPSIDYNLANTSLSAFLYRNGYLGTMAHIEPSKIPLRYL